MFEIGWTEMLVIAVVMIVVVGPKDLPKMLRTFGRTTAKLRAMAGDFQKQFNEALKEAELDDVKKSVEQLRGLNPMNEIRKSLSPFEQAAADVRAGLDTAMKPKPAAAPDVPAPDQPAQVEAEPLKNGAAALPGDPPAGAETGDAAAALGLPPLQPLAPGFPAMADPAPPPAAQPAVAAAVEAKKPRRRKAAEANGAPAAAGKAASDAPVPEIVVKPRVRRPAGSRKKPASPEA